MLKNALDKSLNRNKSLRGISKLNSGTVDLRNYLREVVPPAPGEQRKQWLGRIGHILGLGTTRAESIYYDPRCSLSDEERERIKRASAHIQSIKNCAEILKQKQGELDHELSTELHQLLAQAMELVRKRSAPSA